MNIKKMLAGTVTGSLLVTGCSVTIEPGMPTQTEQETQTEDTTFWQAWNSIPRHERVELCENIEILGDVADDVIKDIARENGFDPDEWAANIYEGCGRL